MLALEWRYALRNLIQNRLRTLLTVLGIALGVAVVLAIQLANRTVLGRFEDSVNLIAGKATHEIVASDGGNLPDSTFRQVRWLWQAGVKASPILEDTVVFPDKSQDILQVVGVDMLGQSDSENQNLNWEMTEAPFKPFDIFNANSCFITEKTASAHQLKLNQPFQVLVGDHLETLRPVGILKNKGLGGAYGGNLIVMDLGGAQALTHQVGLLSRISLFIPKSQELVVTAHLTEVLPKNLHVQPPKRRSQQVGKMLRAFQYNLTALGFIALLVGMFFIYNTMSIALIRRRPEIGTLRALGFSRQRILLLFLSEALLLGGIGTGLGILAGLGLAYGVLQGVSQTVQTLYTGQPAAGIQFSAWDILLIAVTGLILSIVASLPPIWEASRIDPAEALRPGGSETRPKQSFMILLGLGLLLFLFAGIAALQPPIFDFPVWGYAAAFAVILGGAFMLPAVLTGVFRLINSILSPVLGIEFRLGVHQLGGALGRTSVSVASLMVGIAMMISLAVMIGSFRQTVSVWVNQTLRADIWIQPEARTASKSVRGLNPEIVNLIKSTPGVAAVDDFIDRPYLYRDKPANIGAGRTDVLARHGNLQFLSSVPAATLLEKMKREKGAVISESFMLRHHVNPGELLSLETPRGILKTKVIAAYSDYTSEQGYINLDRGLFDEYFPSEQLTGVAVYVKPGTSADTVRSAILKRLPSSTRLTMRSNPELKAEVFRIFESTFGITYALHAIAITVALLCIVNTLFALVLESRREFGILKYLGAEAQQIRKLILLEAAILGGLGHLSGLLIGWILSILLIAVINKQSFGWTIRLDVPWLFFGESFLLVMAASLIAGILPARLAEKTMAPEALRQE